jgi:glycosyltransferase involved in cell wall biosynthesis
VASLLPALVPDFDVVVAAHGDGPLRVAAEAAGARYVPLRWVRRALGWRDLLGFAELAVLFRHERPDIVHVNSSKVGVLGRLAAWLTRAPIRVFTVHAWAFSQHHGAAARLYLWAERLVRPVTTAIVCPSEHTRTEGLAARTCAARSAVVIPNAVDVERALVAQHQARVPTIVSVGRLHEPKDFLTLARALARLEPGSFNALIVGDGPDRARVEEELHRASLDGAVTIAGERTDVRELLAAADIFVLSSRSECMPISVLEAMAAGLPVVASAVGGVPEVVVEGETGLLVPPEHPETLAAVLASLIADAGARERMGAAGRARARARFDLPQFHRAHVELYRRELASRRHDLASARL